MSFTQTDLDKLDQAIAKGVKKVKYNDREVEYRTVNEMLQARQLIVNSFNNNSCQVVTPGFSKGV